MTELAATPLRTIICGHRGARNEAPENTLEAFALCLEMGADMIELDVHASRDGRLVVCHDPELLGMPLCKLDWADIQALAPRLGYSVPSLEEVLELVTGRIALDIEIKAEGFEAALWRLTRGLLQDGLSFFSSFADRVLTTLRDMDSGVRTGLLLGSSRPRQLGWTHRDSLWFEERVAACRPDWLLFHTWLLPWGVLQRAERQGLRTGVWTENRPARWHRLVQDPRVHMIITDYPRQALALRDQYPE